MNRKNGRKKLLFKILSISKRGMILNVYKINNVIDINIDIKPCFKFWEITQVRRKGDLLIKAVSLRGFTFIKCTRMDTENGGPLAQVFAYINSIGFEDEQSKVEKE